MEVAHALFDAAVAVVFLVACIFYLRFNWWVIFRSGMGWVEQRVVGLVSTALLLLVFLFFLLVIAATS